MHGQLFSPPDLSKTLSLRLWADFFKPHGLLILLVWNGSTRVNFSSLRTEQNNSGWKQLWTSCSGVQGNLSLIHQTLQLMWQEVFCLTFLVVIIITTIVTDIVIIIIFIVVIIITMNVTVQKETKGFILPWIRPMTCFSVAHIYKITFVLMNCNQLKQNSLNKKST